MSLGNSGNSSHLSKALISEILPISIGSTSFFLLAISYFVFILVIIVLVRGKVKIQRELKQARDTIDRNATANYEEIALNVLTEKNVAYGHVR